MSEKDNPAPSNTAAIQTRSSNTAKPKSAKLSLLVAVIALGASAYLAYQGIYGKFGIRSQQVLNQQLALQISGLKQHNTQLELKISALESGQVSLRDEIKQAAPSQGSLIVAQLNSLIGGANQSLLLYHDSAAAIRLLSYAKQVLASSDEPQFSEIKINLVKDLDNLQAQTNSDNIMVASQLDDLYRLSNEMQIMAPIAANGNPSTKQSNLWDKFVANTKNTLLGLVKVAKTNPAESQVAIPENALLVREHLQLDLLNAKQALSTQNQELWTTSINDSASLIRQFFTDNSARAKSLLLLQQLGQVHFNTSQADLSSTMQALIKLEQLANWK